MRVGIGLPTSTANATGDLIVEWARRAEQASFSSLGAVDRLAYPNLEPLTALAAAAAVTATIQLVTMVLIGPLRNATLLAKEAASVDVLSGGRLTLGLGVGARDEDYVVAELDPRRRGRRLSDQVTVLKDVWEAGRVGPRPQRPSGPRILLGGGSGEAFARMARHADGYAHGGGPPRAFAGAASKARAAWTDAGRPGTPALWGMAYFALGEGAAEPGAAYLRHYYAFTGPFAEKIAAANLTTPGAIVDFIRGYEDAGCDELILFPTVGALEQLDRLADVLKSR
ncbi:MAG TPA: LLM class flavin-dependent oxidoreductase [Candidatus Limnocylindrales bacterium]|nr:LLM class flavin-dependent oxidoreductase [Candidatus Limnocylindrales bacterium]